MQLTDENSNVQLKFWQRATMLEPQASRDNLLYQTFFTVSKLNSQLQESEAKVQSASLSVEGKVDRWDMHWVFS